MCSLTSSILMSARRSVKSFVLLIAVFVVTGCSLDTFSLKNIMAPWSDQELAYDKIAENLVSSLKQLSELNPDTTAVRVSDTENVFDVELKHALTQSGFDTDPMSDNANVLLVSSEIRKAFTVAGRHKVFSINMGNVSIARAYAVVDGATAPITSQFIMGTQAQDIEINDELFDTPDRGLASVEFRTPESDQKLRVMPTSLEQADEQAEPLLLAANNDSDARKQNYFETGESNYGGLFDEYDDVVSSVLIFPNDSLRLGNSNKAIIDQYVSKLNPETDVLSVLGCSLGTTKIANGNSLLAIGRANRVKEAFLFSGLAHNQVLEEGCWAPEFVQMELPSRGVVVTLKRKKKL